MGLKKRKREKKIQITFSIPEEVNSLLHTVVEKRSLSEFVTKSLELERDSLRKAYVAANEDLDRNEVVDVWSVFDTEAVVE